jgi:hypothetical protein
MTALSGLALKLAAATSVVKDPIRSRDCIRPEVSLTMRGDLGTMADNDVREDAR